MIVESSIQPARAASDSFSQLEALSVFSGAPAQFWSTFLQIIVSLTPAEEALILIRHHGTDDPAAWKEAFCWPPNTQLFAAIRADRPDFEHLMRTAERDGAASRPERNWTAVRLVTGETQRSAVAVARVRENATIKEATLRLRLLADTPLLYQANRSLDQARQDVQRFAVVLDALTLINGETRFMGAAMVLCNELASRYRCERVSLGWMHRGYVELQAMSHTEKFERRMAVATALAQAMDEALDQDEEILWPPPPDSTAVSRDHEAFARSEGVQNVLSLPVRVDGSAVAVVTLERAAREFTLEETQALRLLCDHSGRRLHEMRRRDRWIGARFAAWVRESAARWIGPEHTAAKLGAFAGTTALAILLFGSATYRVEAPFILRSDTLAQVPAPFDGYLDEVVFRVGDPVHAGQPLVSLDPRELLLQEAGAIAERQRYLAEAQKAEGDGNVAEMRIARASADEAQARLELARHRLAQAKIGAPFEGFVVEGDLRERISAPVKQGEVLVKVAKIDAMYPEIAMPERDIHEIAPGQTGEIAFAGRPQSAFPIRVERVQPAAEVREKGNVFILRAGFAKGAESWWRPGMSGVCKVNVGRRNLLWIVAHRTVDFLRMYFWW